MIKHSIKIWMILFFFSSAPLIIMSIVETNQTQNQTKKLTANEASPILRPTTQGKGFSTPPSNAVNDFQKIIYLTFDDGPNRHTIDIMEVLKSKNVQATFFLLEGKIEKNAHIVNELIHNGNTVGCHSISHRIDVFYSSTDVAVDEMKKCQRTIFEQTKHLSPFIRVPFGSFPHLTIEMKNGLENAGFIYWDWNIDSEDWAIDQPEDIIKNIQKQLKLIEQKGHTPTILLHDIEVTTKMLPMLLDYLLKLDYQVIPISSDTQPVQFNRFLTPAS